jgi:MoxR-like ATPase
MESAMKTSASPFPIFDYPETPQTIKKMASWPESAHQFEPEHILALRAAQATSRPLLVRGEAGTGKSQLAHAAAFVTGRAFLPVVVGAHTEASDLHWKFDAIARLADAHMAANIVPARAQATAPTESAAAETAPASFLGERHPELHVSRYLQPGPLWWALNWASALTQQQQCRHGGAHTPHRPDGWTPQKGLVLLIDEIDKAEPDLPNGLLEALANGAFEVPLLGITVEQAQDCPPPLIVITTNDERELPAAFLRRCLVMTLALPEGDKALHEWLVQRGRMHFKDLPDDALEQAADLLVQDRKAARQQRCYTPGLAEYLDLLRALDQLGEEALKVLPTLKQFYFAKQPAAAGLLEG